MRRSDRQLLIFDVSGTKNFMLDLRLLTYDINYLGLILALWLGLYLVSRNPRYPIAWLTALTLWSLAGMFLNVLLALNPPPQINIWIPGLRFLFPFWPEEILSSSTSVWLQGWSIIPAITFWHHVTVLILPGKLTVWRWTRILFGYFLAVVAIVVQTNSPFLFAIENSNPLYLNSLQAGVWYPLFGAGLIILTAACVINLIHSAQVAKVSLITKQLYIMAYATIVAGLTGVTTLIGLAMGLPIPMAVVSLLLASAVVVIGLGVVRYSAFVQGRTMQHDFFANLLLVGVVTLIYWIACTILVTAYQAPAAIMVFVPVLAIITHSLTLPALRLTDWLFYHGETRQFRSNLRRLLRSAGEEGGLEANLGRLLETLCNSLDASYSLILTFDQGNIHWAAKYLWTQEEIDLKASTFMADDIIHLKPGQLEPPLEEAALLVPLYAEAEQLGALILGRPANGLRYADEDVESLLNSTDRIGEILLVARRKSENLAQIARLAEVQHELSLAQSTPIPVETVEGALRNLYDYAFLADTCLAELTLVDKRLARGQVTHLERGKVVHEVLLEAIDKMSPGPNLPHNPPPREWYSYLILHQAYIEEVSNRDIMQKLYISEGTFNRTRRSAIRSLTRALGEMEAALA